MKGVECVGALKALGEESRLRILRLLLAKEHDVNTLAESLGISPYNTSKHLAILKSAGLVTCRKEGRLRLYSVTPSVTVELPNGKKMMDLGCCSFQADQLPR